MTKTEQIKEQIKKLQNQLAASAKIEAKKKRAQDNKIKFILGGALFADMSPAAEDLKKKYFKAHEEYLKKVKSGKKTKAEKTPEEVKK